MGQRILRLYHFQFAHASYTERHRSVGAFVPRLNRFGDSARRELLPDVSQIRETRASHGVLSAAFRKLMNSVSCRAKCSNEMRSMRPGFETSLNFRLVGP